MSNTLYNYYDTDFILSQAGSCTLLLLIEPACFSAVVTRYNRVLAWISSAPIDELLNPEELSSLLNARFNQVIAGVCSGKFTLWPAVGFAPQQTAAIARLLNTEPTEIVLTDRLDQDNAVIYTARPPVAGSLRKHNLTHEAIFGAKGWVKAIMADSPSAQNLYLNVNAGHIDILYCRDGKILFYHSFPFAAADELVYFAILTAQELKLDLTATTACISGRVTAGDPYLTRLAEFFVAAKLNDIRVIELPDEIPAHQVLTVSALGLCASLAEA